MINIASYIDDFYTVTGFGADMLPWQLTADIPALLRDKIATLPEGYDLKDECAIHESSIIETGVVLKGPMIIGPKCFIGAHAYLRGGVWLPGDVSIGPGCEIKSSILFPGSAAAHFNFVGDSIIGRNVNMEAGSIIANHFNERKDKHITVSANGQFIETGHIKFGALVGDGSRIGANAVLQPGTILNKNHIVGRLELVAQVPNK